MLGLILKSTWDTLDGTVVYKLALLSLSKSQFQLTDQLKSFSIKVLHINPVPASPTVQNMKVGLTGDSKLAVGIG